MNYAVHITASGQKDLQKIAQYLYDTGDIDLDFIEKILAFIETIGVFPRKYEKSEQYYSCHFGNYNIFYTILEEKQQVRVFKIVNAKQFSQYKKYFSNI